MTARDPTLLDRQIIILGPKNLQNELLAYVLEKETGTPSCVQETVESDAHPLENQVHKKVLFVDCAGRIIKRTLEEMRAKKAF